MAAAYFEANYPRGFDLAELEVERHGMPGPEPYVGKCADEPEAE